MPDEFAVYRARLDKLATPERAALLKRLCEEYGLGVPVPSMMTTAEVAKMIGVGVDTVEKWRAAGEGPRWHRFGRFERVIGGAASRSRARPRYKRVDVLEWIDSKRVEPARSGT